MPAVSEKQARFARYCEHADHPSSACPKRGTLKHFEHTAKKKPRKGTLLKGDR